MTQRALSPLTQSLAILTAGLLTLGCGGGGGGGAAASGRVSGTSATGAPMVGFVEAVGANGATASTATDAQGKFTLNTTGLTIPIILRITPNNGGTPHYSYSSVSGVITRNVTPLTSLALYLAFGKISLNTVFTQWQARNTALTVSALLSAQATINKNLQPELNSRGLDYSTYDFFRTPFDANGVGFDGVLDGLTVTVPLTDGGTPTVNVATRPGFTFDEGIDTSDVNIPNPQGTSGGGTIAQNETAATIPAHVQTTFNWTFFPNASSSVPTTNFTSGEMVTFTVAANGDLTVDGATFDITLSTPVLRNGNQAEAIWKDTTNNQEFALSSINRAPTPPHEFNLSQDGTFSTFQGQFRAP